MYDWRCDGSKLRAQGAGQRGQRAEGKKNVLCMIGDVRCGVKGRGHIIS